MLEVTFEDSFSKDGSNMVSPDINAKGDRNLNQFDIVSLLTTSIIKQFGGAISRKSNASGEGSILKFTMRADVAAISD